jgi:glutamine synthetase
LCIDLSRINDINICRDIEEAITKLQARHKTHISKYGKGNERRLTGRHETASVS